MDRDWVKKELKELDRQWYDALERDSDDMFLIENRIKAFKEKHNVTEEEDEEWLG